jgi:hypothetical protein
MRKTCTTIVLRDDQKQLLLGTLLGDGCMDWSAKFGRYLVSHGLPQKDYCHFKYAKLQPLATAAPKINKNYGWGDQLCRFSTRSNQCLEFLRPICYRLNPKTGRLAKHVTPEWLALLDWEGIAYWYLDDGSISKNTSGNANAVFSTHGFPREEVELLARMLTDRGVEAKAIEVHRGPKAY